MSTDIQLYLDESLESFLLRLSQDQGYERFSHFAEDIWYQTLDEHESMSGAFPLELNQINIYHAHTTSQMRVCVLIHLERQLKLNNFGVLRLALTHSKAQFSPKFKAVHRFGVDYPFAFLCKRFTPVCPMCLTDAPYIRQHWQFIPVRACAEHGCKLLHHCPECGRRLEYQNSERIQYCECGYNLTEAEPEVASESELIVARWLGGESPREDGVMSKEMTTSERYGFLLWYVNRYGDLEEISFDTFIKYCSVWPEPLHQELDKIVEKAELVRVKQWRKVFFREVFGSLLQECRQAPSRQLDKNIVLGEILHYFTRLVANNPSLAKGNIADVLLSPFEASTLLSCSTDEVYRLYDFGEIQAAVRQKMHTKIASHEPVFALRGMVETKLARMCSEGNGLSVYLSQW
ncbi:TniQ family protein [Vibrio sp. CAU 1672]|uniref:TniQ family protein n=1 Tax=Vibrio sp. CAU 1672 TaxID=3032594 RepID=UPI0023D9B2A1|nr:TniQ family protein [Vibrio sp. CAU 1672]MDF2152878.1 TniQ family protein [Vibrio sp. CAU 1672]